MKVTVICSRLVRFLCKRKFVRSDATLEAMEVCLALLAAKLLVRFSPVSLPFFVLRTLGTGRCGLSFYDPRLTRGIAVRIAQASELLPCRFLCLHQALAASFLFWRRSLPLFVGIGVREDEIGKVRAHAWTASLGNPITGGKASELGFKELATFGSACIRIESYGAEWRIDVVPL
ncbi:lasso peptide biosynthesis B2 protein [Pelagicoccus enzymogenes]|uniref:lasso peptide biosynthesis B2 protein n=1 Tax=Pelagicoccus enzymogenes TaxID=2773457 RepID=UPI003CE57E9D